MTTPWLPRAMATVLAALAIALPALGGELALDEVAPGIYAALQEEAGRFNDSNSVVVISNEDIVVIDSQSDPDTVRSLIAAVRKISQKPVRHLINTHFHSDHTAGNFIYRDQFPGLEILGHPSLLEDVPNRSQADHEKTLEYYRTEIPAAEERLAEGTDREGKALDDDARATLAEQIGAAKARLAKLETVEWALPTLTVDSSLTLHRSIGPIEVRAVHAHTRGDLIVYLPQAKVLVTGDVLDDLPFGGHGFPGDWIEVLEELDGMDWDVMIPGHGSVRKGAEARAHLALVRSMFETMVAAAGESVQSGQELESAKTAFAESEDVAKLRLALAGEDAVAQKNFDHFVPPGFERAYLEAKGELPD